MKLFVNQKVYSEYQFKTESEFERDIVSNSKLLFGNKTIYIDAKRKIETKSLGNSIPDGFLFDLNNIEKPEFYIVEAELVQHDFFKHIFPQVTKFFGFYKNQKNHTELIEKLDLLINNDKLLYNQFKSHLKKKEIYKFIKDTLERSQNILLIIDGEKKEMPEIIETYTDTWGKMVKHIVLKKFASRQGDKIYTMHPEFENIEFSGIENESFTGIDNETSEEMHFEGVSNEVNDIYKKIKKELLIKNRKLVFNPQKYYISIKEERNFAFFLVRRKKIVLVVMKPFKDTKKLIKYHFVKELGEGVQKFYNGACCAIEIENTSKLSEVIRLLKMLYS